VEGKRRMYGRKLHGAREAARSDRRWRLYRYALIEGVNPDRVGPGAPPRAVNGDDPEPFRLRGVAPRPFRDFGEFDRRLSEPASDPAQRGEALVTSAMVWTGEHSTRTSFWVTSTS
jgi:hypothetical protein